jgi:hypothetical protein
MIWSPERCFIPPWPFPRQSDCNENADRRRPPDCDPGAHTPIAHPLYEPNPYDLISREATEKEKWREGVVLETVPCGWEGRPASCGLPGNGRRNPLKRLNSRKRMSFACIFLPPLRAAGDLSGPMELDEQQREFDLCECRSLSTGADVVTPLRTDTRPCPRGEKRPRV